MRGILLAAVAACALVSACSGHGDAAKAADPHPSASTRASAAPPADQVPKGFRAVSATFVSDTTGWVLGSVPCQGEGDDCGAVARTTDGGRSWHLVSRLPATEHGELRFADARNGFLLAGGLSVTHDGGRTWRPVDTLRDAIHEPWSAEAAQGLLWLTGRVDHGGRGLWVGSVRRASFDFAPVDLPDGDDDLLLSLHGRAVVLAYLDHGAPRALVSENGDLFTARDLPCVPTGPLAMRTTRSYLLACADQVRMTSDAGRSWHELAASPASGVPLVTPDSLFVAWEEGLWVSRDEGRTWSGALGEVNVRSAGFESARLGFVISDGGVMRVTRDDGRSWETVDFRRTS